MACVIEQFPVCEIFSETYNKKWLKQEEKLEPEVITTKKPVKVIRAILKDCEGNLVLDCFIGSGSTAVACKQLNKDYIGFEINPKYIEICKQRLNQNTLTAYNHANVRNKK